MKQIAEKEFPSNYEPSPMSMPTSHQLRQLYKQEGYELASTHWAACFEWLSGQCMIYDNRDKVWYHPDDRNPCEGMTTTELFEYWYNNVKDK
jgi:hypothetical protein